MKKTKSFEHLIYFLIVSIILIIPVFMLLDRNVFSWNRLFLEWMKYLPFLLILLISNFILLPFFLFRKRYFLFFLLVIALVFFSTYLWDLTVKPLHDWLVSHTEFPHPRPGSGLRPPGGRPGRPPVQLHMMEVPYTTRVFNNAIISFLVIGLNAAIKTFARWVDHEHQQRQLEEQAFKSELAFLKHQISPHFFMNTLNNIHALVDINREDAKQSIIKLSKMMRYLLYESKDGFSTLQKEADFISSYIELMKLRFEDGVEITFSYPEAKADLLVPGFLYLTFIENAFKHGISQRGNSYITVEFAVDDNELIFRTQNSLSDPKLKSNLEASGVGLENVRKRLDLLYNEGYHLYLNETTESFEVELRIPLL